MHFLRVPQEEIIGLKVVAMNIKQFSNFDVITELNGPLKGNIGCIENNQRIDDRKIIKTFQMI